MNQKIRISGTGCALADFVYSGIDFLSPEFQKFVSKKKGDGGLSPGRLVFTGELEEFSKKTYPEIISEITNGKEPDSFNIGGPSLVSLIHAAQILPKVDFEVDFYGISGKDNTSHKIRKLLQKTPINFSNYIEKSEKPTPYTHVLSDPGFDNGNGERTFINNIGAAWDLTPNELPDKFFSSNIVCFGGTALSPDLHDNLHFLLDNAKQKGALTIVNTVYDFRNEKQNPGNQWPLGDSERSFPNIDLLIMDNEEALKISGQKTIVEAFEFFKSKTHSFIITRGSDSVLFYSKGGLFIIGSGELPVSELVKLKIQKKEFTGDTTGCGDNFVGGVIASVAMQIYSKQKGLNLREAVISGICAGGFTCSYYGGTYFEKAENEKKQQINFLMEAYNSQLK